MIPSLNLDYDVTIVGGGLVGASLAVALRGSGLRAALLEAIPYHDARQPSFDDRSLALSYGSRRIFEALGVWGQVARADISPIRQIHISDRGRFGMTRLAARDMDVDALGYVVASRAIGAALLAMLDARENIEVLTPANVRNVVTHRDYAEVVVQHADNVRTLRTRLVVAADGGDSTVRQAVGLAAARRVYPQRALVTNVALERDHNGTAYERFTPEGPIAILPWGERRCAVVWAQAAQAAETALAWDDALFLQHLQSAFGDRLGRFVRVGRRHTYPLVLTRVPDQTHPRLVLIGNAAHTVHPVAGQGFNLGLRDVAALAEFIVDAHAGGDDVGAEAMLARYAQSRRADTRAISYFTDGLVRIFSNNSAPWVAARNVGLLTVDLLPPIKRGLLRLTMGLGGRLPRLARGIPL